MAGEIGQWLESHGLGEWIEAFLENRVDLDAARDLTEADLKDLGIPMGPRKKLLRAISALGDEQVGTAERRQLTVMFCDLVGSTELSGRLDPEDLREVMRRYQDAVAGAVTRYEGYVAKFLGDGVLAYFGWPQAHEDQAARAVRTGLDAVAAVARLEPDHNVVLEARVGIATGRVVVGDLVGETVSEAEAVTGETPNLAARLQDVAAPGQVVIDATTRLLVGETFEFGDLGAHELKGFAEPITAWHVVGEIAAESRFEAEHVGGELPLVGRQEELGHLLGFWEASKDGHGQVVLIQGEPGVGKSRLVEALRERLSGEHYIRVIRRCSPYHSNSTLYPVIEHLKRVLDWKPEDDPETKLSKLEAGLEGQSLPLAEAVPLYAELMSLALPEGRYAPLELSAKEQRERTLDALAGWLLKEAERTPVLNIWEDLHWADPTTLELLAHYIDQSPAVSMMSLLTHRSEFEPPWPMRPHMTPITLNRLERPEVEALIGHQANGKELPAEVVDHIVEKTDGVPLYVEELTKSILGSDYLREETERYALTGSLSEVAIPATLQDSLMARLDRVPRAREVAQLGAVLGREFTYEMLRAVAPLEETTLIDGLVRLVDAELLYQRGRPPRAKYIFKHALVQEAAYESLLKRTRQQYHRQVAVLMEERFPETIAAHPELVAHHYREAGCTEEAISHFRKAGQIALGRSANVEAAAHFERSLEQLAQLPETPERHERELEMQMALGPALVAARGFGVPAVGQAYARAWELCRLLEDDARLPLVLRGRQVFHLMSGEWNEAREFAEEFIKLAERLQDPALMVGSYHALGQTLFFHGDLTASRSTVENGIALFDPARHRLSNWSGGQPGEQCYLYGAFSLWMLGYPDQAMQRSEEALAMAKELRNPVNLINTLIFVAAVHVLRRDLSAARQRSQVAMEMSAEQRHPNFLAYGMVLHGWAQAALDQGEDGIAEIQRGIASYRATGMRAWLPYLLGLQAETCARVKQIDDGLASVVDGLALTDKTEERCWEAELNRIKGELLLAASSNNSAEAESCFSQALDIARRQQAKSWELRAAMSLARLWQAQGKTDEARTLLVQIHTWFNEGFDTADLQDSKELLTALY